MRFALLLPLSFATHIAFAQSSQPIGADAERNLSELGSGGTTSMVRTYDNRYEGVKGSPFFNEEWNKAIITAGNKVYENIDVKFNAYENNILYRNTKGEEFVLEPAKLESFVLVDTKTKQEYTFRQFPVLAAQDAKLAKQFVLVLFDGDKSQLIMVPEKSLVKADYKGAYSNGKNYDELVDAQSFYFIGPDKKAAKMKLSKKNLLKVLPDKQDKVQEFASSNKLDLNSGEGWAKALAYYETL